jgi:hypothetical protein
MILDLLTGLFLLAVLSAVLFVAVQARTKGAARLAESRAALRTAEAALGELQAGAAQPSGREGVEIRVMDEPQSKAPAGMRWVRVEATCAGKTASLRGVVPAAGGQS